MDPCAFTSDQHRCGKKRREASSKMQHIQQRKLATSFRARGHLWMRLLVACLALFLGACRAFSVCPAASMEEGAPCPWPLVGQLFSGPVDIVGDVHGESGALLALLDRLGYDGNGHHDEGRRLVFVGDLIDRGPDSPGVVRLVKHLVEAKQAQCILGNHELNIMRGERKHGNSWFYGEPEIICKDKGNISFQVLADDNFRADARAFFATLPMALEREDLLVVHAAWDNAAVAKLRDFRGDALTAYNFFTQQLKARIEEDGIKDPDEIDLIMQNENPITVLSSGYERRAPEPFFAGGKMRNLERWRWWEDYEPEDGRLIVIGHYWRRLLTEVNPRVYEKYPDGFTPTGTDMFPGLGPADLLGPTRKVMCVDYAVGVRYEERGMGLPDGALGTQIAALRFPEMTLHFGDSRVMQCQ